MVDADANRALYQVAGLGAVIVVIFERVFDGFGHDDRSCKMHDRADFMLAQGGFDQRLIGNVATHQRHPIGHRPVEPGDKIVDDDDAIAGVLQSQYGVAADIACAACYQDRRFVAHKE